MLRRSKKNVNFNYQVEKTTFLHHKCLSLIHSKWYVIVRLNLYCFSLYNHLCQMVQIGRRSRKRTRDAPMSPLSRVLRNFSISCSGTRTLHNDP